MKTQQEQLEQLLGTLLQHQPLIDATYDQLNSVAIALIKDGYGDVTEYKAQIETLKTKIFEKDYLLKQTQLNYDRAFERLKAQQKEIEKLKSERDTQHTAPKILGNEARVEFHDDTVSTSPIDCKDIEKYAKLFRNRILSSNEKEIKQAKLNLLAEVKKRLLPHGKSDVVFPEMIDDIIAEVERQ